MHIHILSNVIILLITQLSASFGHNDMRAINAFFRSGGKLNVLLFYGRNRFSRVLIEHLRRFRRSALETIHESRLIDQVFVAVNTKVIEDLNFLDEFIDGKFFVKLILNEKNEVGPRSVYGWCQIWETYLKNATYSAPNTMVVKLDDDIVYIHPLAFANLLHFKLLNRNVFLVSANVVNHNELALVHSQTGVFFNHFKYNQHALEDYFFDSAHFFSPEAAALMHNVFLSAYRNNSVLKTYNSFYAWDFNAGGYGKTFGINAILFDPADVPYDYKLCVKGGDEAYLSQVLPNRFKRHCVAVGSAVFVHFSYEFQKFESADILNEYAKIVGSESLS